MKALPLIALLISLIALFVAFSQKTNTDIVQEPVYANVLKTGTLRCAYTPFAPLTIIDANTKDMSGISYDIMDEIGKRLGLKIEWNEEVSWSDIAAGFGNRYDAFCTGMWPAANRARNTLFTNGLYWDPVGVFVRADDARFTNDPLALNDPSYTIAVLEGDGTEVMAGALLPLAKRLPLTNIGSTGDLFAHITTKKADAGMGTRISGVYFIEQNPGVMKEVVPEGKPFRVYPVTIGLPEGEYGLKKMLDAVIFELQDDGTIERIIKKYLGERKGMLYRQKVEYEPL